MTGPLKMFYAGPYVTAPGATTDLDAHGLHYGRCRNHRSTGRTGTFVLSKIFTASRTAHLPSKNRSARK